MRERWKMFSERYLSDTQNINCPFCKRTKQMPSHSPTTSQGIKLIRLAIYAPNRLPTEAIEPATHFSHRTKQNEENRKKIDRGYNIQRMQTL